MYLSSEKYVEEGRRVGSVSVSVAGKPHSRTATSKESDWYALIEHVLDGLHLTYIVLSIQQQVAGAYQLVTVGQLPHMQTVHSTDMIQLRNVY